MPVLLVSLAIVVLDQVTKVWVLRTLGLGEQVHVIPGFFSLSHIQNSGAAWGTMQGWGHWLVLLSILLIGGMLVFRRHFVGDTLFQKILFGVLMGGVWGNLLDRVKWGYVVDFLDFHWRGSHFPAFNVADAAICVGVGLYMVLQFRNARRGADSSNAA
jgi:signal peptidase II